jgi:hypothetical protein
LNLGHFVGFLFCAVFSILFFTFMRQLQNNIWGTISRIGGWKMNTKIIKTETSLHLNLEILFLFLFNLFFYIFTFYFFIYIFHSFTYFLFLFLSLFFLFFYFQSSLCLSNAFPAYGWLVHCLSLFISLKFFVCFFVLFFSTCLFVFLFSFNFFAFHPLSPFHTKYHYC